MSLFENSEYQWRETYFLFFKSENRPEESDVSQALAPLKARLKISDMQNDDEGLLESLTIIAPGDSAGIDITFVSGEEIAEQKQELKKEIIPNKLTTEDRIKYDRMMASDSRFDLFHFQQVGEDPSDDDVLDPGSLLSVLSRLTKLCDGVAYDPQSGTFF